MLLSTLSRALGVLGEDVGSVSSQLGSGRHLPGLSCQPDPYPQPSPAQQSSPQERIPAGGVSMLGQTKAGRARGAPQPGPLTRVPGPAGPNGPRQTAPCLLCCLLLLLLRFNQPHRPQGLTGGGGGELDGEGGREGSGQMNTMKRLTRSGPAPLLLSPPFMRGYSLWAGGCPVLSPV